MNFLAFLALNHSRYLPYQINEKNEINEKRASIIFQTPYNKRKEENI